MVHVFEETGVQQMGTGVFTGAGVLLLWSPSSAPMEGCVRVLLVGSLEVMMAAV